VALSFRSLLTPTCSTFGSMYGTDVAIGLLFFLRQI